MGLNEIPLVWQYLIIFLVQLGYTMVRTNNIQHAVSGTIWQNQISSTVLIIFYIVSSALGVKGVLEGDLMMIFWFILGNNVGMTIVLKRQGRAWR